MKTNFLKYLVLSCSVMVFLSACVKDKFSPTQATGAGVSYARITQAKVYNQFFSPFLTIKPINMFSVRRDAASNDALQASNSITLKDVSLVTSTRTISGAPVTKTYIDWYNYDHATPYVLMPTTLYTVQSDPTITPNTTGFVFNFGPGDFAKNLTFNVDGSKVDLSKQYAVAYAITNTGGLTQKAGLDTVLVTVAIKNKYDGYYTTTGSMLDVTSTSLTHINNFLASAGNTFGIPNPLPFQLQTTGANTCNWYDSDFFGGFDVPITSGTSYSSYGTFSPVITFDLATDKIVSVANYYGQAVPPANGRTARLDPTGTVNAYVNGKITIKYNMCQPSSVPVAPYVRTTWDEVWTYFKSR